MPSRAGKCCPDHVAREVEVCCKHCPMRMGVLVAKAPPKVDVQPARPTIVVTEEFRARFNQAVRDSALERRTERR